MQPFEVIFLTFYQQDGLLPQLIHHLNERQEHRNHDATHDDREKYNHDGFQQ